MNPTGIPRWQAARPSPPPPALPVALRLGRDHVPVRYVELAVQDGVAGGILVDIGRAVADPLPGHEDRQLDVQLDLAHFKRSCVVVAHQVAYQRPVGGAYLGPPSVGYPGCLHNGPVVAHVIDDSHESVVEPGDRGVEYFFERRDGGAQRLVAALALLVHLVLLLGSHNHGSLLRTVGFSGLFSLLVNPVSPLFPLSGCRLSTGKLRRGQGEMSPWPLRVLLCGLGILPAGFSQPAGWSL